MPANEEVEESLVERPPRAESAMAPRSEDVMAMLGRMIDKGTSPEALEKLVDLYERVANRAAAQEFARALAEFQAACPAIPKTSTSKKNVTTQGTKFDFNYAALDQIAAVVGPLLHPLGLSYSWDSVTTDKTITCTCTLRHVNGHRESATFASPTDSALPIGSQQRVGAALSYARRYSLIQVLGISTTEPDRDGDDGSGYQPITEAERATLEAMLNEIKVDRDAFLKFVGVTDLKSLPASSYRMAVNALEAKRKRS